MSNARREPRRWATKVQPVSALPTAHDFTLIGVNLEQCRASRGRWFRLLCASDAVGRFVASRVLTTVVVVVAVCAAVAVLA